MSTRRIATSLVDSVIDACSTHGKSAGRFSAYGQWTDSGELFYDWPALNVTPSIVGKQTETNGANSEYLHTPAGLRIDAASMPAYVLNCPEHANRLTKLKASMAAEGFNVDENLSVVPCETLTGTDEDCLVESGLLSRVGLRRGEAAVAVAHSRAWQLALSRAMAGFAAAVANPSAGNGDSGTESRWHHAVFLEDDATFRTGGLDALQGLLDEITLTQRKALNMFAIWNGDWLWNTEKQRLIFDSTRGGTIDDAFASSQQNFGPSVHHVGDAPPSSPPAEHSQLRIFEATGTSFFIPGGVAYILSIGQIQLLLDHIYPIDKPLDALLCTGSGGGVITDLYQPNDDAGDAAVATSSSDSAHSAVERRPQLSKSYQHATGGHFLIQPAEPREIDKTQRRFTPIIATGDAESANLT